MSLSVICDNCGWIGKTEDCDEIQDFWMRVEPGEEIPEGECPKCGCLAYVAKTTEQKTEEINADLLAALKELVDYEGYVIDAFSDYAPSQKEEDAIHKDFQQARDAIAKAEGKE